MNQTRVTATTPDGTTAALTVDTGQLANASPAAWDNLETLIRSVLRRKGADPDLAEWSAQPIGPQVRLVTLNGAVL
jgi:hypothetical protein